eukprot:TRINITY_DN2451_c0_g1_i3.p1 TRINITY_DN2451_c0_g1~~TRINITY_DN2451_c0_g1_i3.p1  ORF type:complete len:122 (-),score=23.81 TRINITY_DN2451_c0_g1_i3:166-531(-)
MIYQSKIISEFNLEDNSIKSLSIFYDRENLLTIDLQENAPLSQLIDDSAIQNLIGRITDLETQRGSEGSQRIEKEKSTIDRIYGQHQQKMFMRQREDIRKSPLLPPAAKNRFERGSRNTQE